MTDLLKTLAFEFKFRQTSIKKEAFLQASDVDFDFPILTLTVTTIADYELSYLIIR